MAVTVPASMKNAKIRFNAGMASAGIVGFDFTILLQLLPIFTSLFSLCKKVPPPNPTPNPTAAQQKAYEWHWHATTNYVGGADRYKESAVKQGIRELKKQKKAKGEPISKDEARVIVIKGLDECRLNDEASLAELIQANS